MLECAPGSVMIPAHVWTPWLRCLAPNLALTGLKTATAIFPNLYLCPGNRPFVRPGHEPPYQRARQAYALVSNSDAHSGGQSGPRGQPFAGSPSYAGMFAACAHQPNGRIRARWTAAFLEPWNSTPTKANTTLTATAPATWCLNWDSLALGNIWHCAWNR